MKVRIRVRPFSMPDRQTLTYRLLWGVAAVLAFAVAPALLVFQGRTGTTPPHEGHELIYVPVPGAAAEETNPAAAAGAPEPAPAPAVPRQPRKRRFQAPRTVRTGGAPLPALPEPVAIRPQSGAPIGPLIPLAAGETEPLPGSIAVRRKRGLWRTEAGTLVPFHDELEYRSVSLNTRIRITTVRRTNDGYVVIGSGSGEPLELRITEADAASRLLSLGAADGAGGDSPPVSGKPTQWRLLW